jgi:hypothetical protein
MKYSSFGAELRLLVQSEMRRHLQHVPTPWMVVISESEKSQLTFARRARMCTSPSNRWLLLEVSIPVR